MNCSETLGELAKALSKAQSVMGSAIKSNENPYFKSKYADLAAVWEACREPLTANGLSVVQIPCDVDGRVGVETILLHSSGEWISGMLLLKPVKDDPQAAGSAITYARRYGLQAAAGVATEDDDGNAASQPDKKRAVTDKPIELGRPGVVPASSKGPTSPASNGGSTLAAGPAAQPEIFVEKLKADVKAKQEPGKKEGSFVEFEACISIDDKKHFAEAWRLACKENHPSMKSAEIEKTRGEWLTMNGFVKDNKPTSALIPKALFPDMVRVACQYVKKLTPNSHGIVVDETDVVF